MATIKSHSDLDQSRKLAEILPLESADMCYTSEDFVDEDTGDVVSIEKVSFGHPSNTEIGCWSLAALLGVLPSYEINNFGNGIQLDVKNEAFVTEGDETLLDLVVNMIIHLHELKKL